MLLQVSLADARPIAWWLIFEYPLRLPLTAVPLFPAGMAQPAPAAPPGGTQDLIVDLSDVRRPPASVTPRRGSKEGVGCLRGLLQRAEFYISTQANFVNAAAVHLIILFVLFEHFFYTVRAHRQSCSC